MPYLLIFSGLKPLPLNSLNPIKVTVPRDPFCENFDSGTSELIVPALCEILCVVPLCCSNGAVHPGAAGSRGKHRRAMAVAGQALPG